MASQDNQAWRTYEEVARHLLDQIADRFGIARVEGKQTIQGHKSGTDWEIDAKGIGADQDVFLIIECRRYTASKQSQERVGALAYRIHDTGASGGIIVSPLGLQEGAQKIAKAENIHTVVLNPNCTTTEYILRLLNELHLGVSGSITFRGSLTLTKVDAQGTIIETRTYDGA